MIIGLVGFAGSGKDTTADILQAKGFHRDSFAKPVKDAVSVIFGWDREVLEGGSPESRVWREQPDPYWSEKFGKPFTPRKALQLMGTEIGREIYHQNLWVDAMERRLALRSPSAMDVVITDVRFVNEMQMIDKMGGTVVRVMRGQNPPWYYDAQNVNFDLTLGVFLPDVARHIRPDVAVRYPSLADHHISEWGWIGSPLITYQIDNNGTLDDLKWQVDTMVNTLPPG